jgi:hypothetical protein
MLRNTGLKGRKMQAAPDDGTPKFGRLLIVLVVAVLLVAVITFVSEAWYS